MESFLEQFYTNLLGTSLLEIVAVVFGILSVVFARKENILVYPTGIVSVLIYIYLCFFAKLYADMGINIFYFGMSVYGWYMWTHKKLDVAETRPITKSSKKENIIGIIAFVVFYVIFYFILNTYTDSDVPQWDALTTSIFIIGMYLMAIKKVENWIYWIIGDFISIPLYIYKGLAFSGFQFAVFLILAILGYLEWKKRLQNS